MALDTYANLQTAVAKWAWTTGLTEFEATIPDMIALLEARLNRELRVADMEKTTTLALSSSAATLPEDYLEFRRVVASTSPPQALSLVSPEWAADAYKSTASGVPQHFTIVGNKLTVYPSTTARISLTYYQRIPALADDLSNWLLCKAPDVYLFGTLLEAGDFMQDSEQLQKFASRFDAAIKSLEKADASARYSRAAMRVTGPTP